MRFVPQRILRGPAWRRSGSLSVLTFITRSWGLVYDALQQRLSTYVRRRLLDESDRGRTSCRVGRVGLNHWPMVGTCYV